MESAFNVVFTVIALIGWLILFSYCLWHFYLAEKSKYQPGEVVVFRKGKTYSFGVIHAVKKITTTEVELCLDRKYTEDIEFRYILWENEFRDLVEMIGESCGAKKIEISERCVDHRFSIGDVSSAETCSTSWVSPGVMNNFIWEKKHVK